MRAMNGGTQGRQALCWSQGGCGQGEEALSARNSDGRGLSNDSNAE